VLSAVEVARDSSAPALRPASSREAWARSVSPRSIYLGEATDLGEATEDAALARFIPDLVPVVG
jgi:hypothetical protein